MEQYIIIAIVLAAAVFYAGYRVYDTLSNAGNPCHGCSGCAMQKQMKKHKNFGRRKPVCMHKI